MKFCSSTAFLASIAFGTLGAILPYPAEAETVNVKYRGTVDLAPFQCEWTKDGSRVTRLCYDARERYVIVNLQGTYYHYCEVPAGTVAQWRKSDSLGRFFDTRVKGNFDCRVNRVPSYK